jgi:hypothetical protein
MTQGIMLPVREHEALSQQTGYVRPFAGKRLTPVHRASGAREPYLDIPPQQGGHDPHAQALFGELGRILRGHHGPDISQAVSGARRPSDAYAEWIVAHLELVDEEVTLLGIGRDRQPENLLDGRR